MSADIYTTLGPKALTETPQTEKADDRQEMNHAGGFTFTLDRASQARRFLILGSDAGTYYASAKAHTIKATQPVLDMASDGDMQLLDLVEDVSFSGLAPRQQPTLVALAAATASPSVEMRERALAMVPKVCRTFTMLATFMNYAKTFRGTGRGLRRAVGRFYEQPVDRVAHQAVKYRQREGWTHRDMLRVAHPDAVTPEHKALFDWICGRDVRVTDLPEIVQAYAYASETKVTHVLASLVADHDLPWEAIPDDMVNRPEVLRALMRNMPAGALIRQLPRFARGGITGSFGGELIAERLRDEEFIHKSRVHPYQVLVASRTYGLGRSFRGTGDDWTPSPKIVAALDEAFEHSFKSIEPCGKNVGLFLDVSGSMSAATIANSCLTARDGSAAMALATLRTEPNCIVAGFTSFSGSYSYDAAISVLDVSPRDSLNSVIDKISGLPFGGTDCSLPMIWAMENAPETEVFVVYTDNETWAGGVHPHEALKRYRAKTGVNAKLIVVGMTATKFTIADPTDTGMLDVVGFDASAPAVISQFAAGKF